MGLIDMHEYSITDVVEERERGIILSNFEAKEKLNWFSIEVDELLEIFSNIKGISASVNNDYGDLIFDICKVKVITCSKASNSINIDFYISALSPFIGEKELKLLINDVVQFFCMVISKKSKPLAEKAIERFDTKKQNDWDYSSGFDINSWLKNDVFTIFIDKTIK